MKYLYISPEKCSIHLHLEASIICQKVKLPLRDPWFHQFFRRKWHFMSEKEHSQASECGVCVCIYIYICCQVASVVSKSVQPHRRQPTRLPRPWDSPGKNTGGLPFPSPMHEGEKSKWSHSVVSDSQRPHGLQPTRPVHPWDFPGKSPGVSFIGRWILYHWATWEAL